MVDFEKYLIRFFLFLDRIVDFPEPCEKRADKCEYDVYDEYAQEKTDNPHDRIPPFVDLVGVKECINSVENLHDKRRKTIKIK